MPPSFDLAGANVGNLILCGGYLSQNRHIDPVVFLFSRLVEVRGVVRPTTSEPLHLAAELEDGSLVVGQHRLTGKEVPPLHSPIRRLFLTRRIREPAPVVPELRAKVEALVKRADLICYPMGSFYTSLLPNLKVRGVGRAVAQRGVPKVYIPNTSQDPEMRGLRLPDAVRILVNTLRESGDEQASTSELLNYVLVDEDPKEITARDLEQVREQGVEVIRAPLCTARSAPLLDPQHLVEILVSLA
jgi:CofD-related protein of GAK system